jgi:hypothetical protein
MVARIPGVEQFKHIVNVENTWPLTFVEQWSLTEADVKGRRVFDLRFPAHFRVHQGKNDSVVDRQKGYVVIAFPSRF